MSPAFGEETLGAARTPSWQEKTVTRSETPADPPRGLLHVSEAAGDWSSRRREEVSKSTADEDRYALWQFFEFLACDPPVTELAADTLSQFMHWLRTTPIAARKSRLPREFSRAAVSSFFQWPPRRKAVQGLRGEQTVGRCLRHLAPFLEFLKLPTELKKKERPRLDLPPPLVPSKQSVAGWWHDALTASTMPEGSDRLTPPTASERRQVVLIQALILLTGLRCDEALSALSDDVEGHFLLIRETKTHKPRIIYLCRQALGIIAALHPVNRQRLLFAAPDGGAAKFITGWTYTESTWHGLVRDCTSPQNYVRGDKRQQQLRRMLSTWICRQKRPREAGFPPEVVEAAQLGHGKGVVFRHYLDVLRDIPKYLERYRLPPLDGFDWPSPIEARLRRPDRLYREFRAIINRR